VTRGGIGVSFVPSETIRPRLLKEAGVTEGVFVEAVTAGGASDKAGIKAEDIIVSLNGKPVRNGNDLVDTVTTTPWALRSTSGCCAIISAKASAWCGDLAQLFRRSSHGEREESNKAEAPR